MMFFLPGSGFLSRLDMIKTVESDKKNYNYAEILKKNSKLQRNFSQTWIST